MFHCAFFDTGDPGKDCEVWVAVGQRAGRGLRVGEGGGVAGQRGAAGGWGMGEASETHLPRSILPAPPHLHRWVQVNSGRLRSVVEGAEAAGCRLEHVFCMEGTKW